MTRKDYIAKMDEFAELLVKMGCEGFLNDPEANTAAGAAQYELSKLREFVKDELS
ncbi:hypothetical protein LCGC14_1058340 [marine sediment metagenome]|uniref:Uncharacterized protein n=1 Tax=marine sediment metagenome TaxID=412755 RepID=A0A0F9MRI1_9ZZZZ